MSRHIYFDNAPTTPLDPRVLDVMCLTLIEDFANPSSLHQPGREARQAVESARQQVALLLNADPREIIFTASGTEADNMALMGVIEAFNETHSHHHQRF